MGETPKPRSESLDVARASRPWDLSLKAFSCWVELDFRISWGGEFNLASVESPSSGYTPWSGRIGYGIMSAPALRPRRVPRLINLMP